MSKSEDNVSNNTLKQLNKFIEGFAYEDTRIIEPKEPVLLVMGCPRSGTTLLYQYLASTGSFAFPSNLMSKFCGSPKFGAMLQKILTMENSKEEISFESKLGKTKGLLQPNEYWHFWRRFFPVDFPAPVEKSLLDEVDRKKFIFELAMFENELKLPLLLKGMILCFNIDFLNKIFRNAIFVHIKRDPIFNAQALLNARMSYFHNIDSWYSTKPKQYYDLIKKNPYYQVAGQVYYTSKAIDEQLNNLNKDNHMTIEYEEFCKSPNYYFELIKDKYKGLGSIISGNMSENVTFKNSNTYTLKDKELKMLKNAFKEIHDLESSRY